MTNAKVLFLEKVINKYGDVRVSSDVNEHILIIRGIINKDDTITDNDIDNVFKKAVIVFSELYIEFSTQKYTNTLNDLFDMYDKREISMLIGCSDSTVEKLQSGTLCNKKYYKRIDDIIINLKKGELVRFDDIGRSEEIRTIKERLDILVRNVGLDEISKVLNIGHLRLTNIITNTESYSTVVLKSYNELLRKYMKRTKQVTLANVKKEVVKEQIVADFSENRNTKSIQMMTDAEIVREFNYSMELIYKKYGKLTQDELEKLTGIKKSRFGNMKTRPQKVTRRLKILILNDIRIFFNSVGI